jgi:hypothetical protein
MSQAVSISVIDLMGEIKGGVAILFSLKIKNKIYELIYWFDNKDNFRIVIDQDFLKDFNLNDIYEYENLFLLIKFIEKNIPDKQGLLKKYKIN